MCDDLEDFYGNLQELDHWLDQAIERSEDLKMSRDGIDTQYSNFKVSSAWLVVSVLKNIRKRMSAV